MNYEMKTINKTLLVSWLSIIGILFSSYLLQVIRHEREMEYLIVFAVIMILPWIVVFAMYKTKNDWDKLGYMIVFGYSFMYTFVMFTGATLMVSNYILPLLFFLILYHKPFLVIYTFVIAITINILSTGYFYTQDAYAAEHVKDIMIRFASIIICFAGAYVSAKLYDQIHKEREHGIITAIKAEAANDAKGEFLAHMSHEIRTPINAVLGMDTMILRESKEPHIKEYAMDIQRAARNLLSIINDILDISKIESGKMEIVPVDYDFSSLVNDTVNMVQEKARNKGLELHVEVDSDIPCCMHGDDVRIRQVLVNILGNAVKYTENGSVTLSIKGSKNGNMEKLHFSVKDTGIGIKEEDLHKLFAEFERIEELRNRHIEGTGLGMSITVNLLNMMGSSLDVKSEYGVGSEFSFDLEQEIIKNEAIGNIAARIAQMAEEYEYETTFTAPDARVLVVDDNQTNLLVFRNLLKETELQVDTSDSGVEALDMIKDTVYDIIFLDHMMPDMDGIEVMQRIISSDDHMNVGVPVIALTANAIVGARETYIGAGFTDYLSKPIIPEKLEKLISDYLPKEKIKVGQRKETTNKKASIKYQESLPMIEGVDWEYARLHLGNSEAILTTVENVYNSIELDADELTEYYARIINSRLNNEEDNDAIDSFRIKVHSLKSTATLLGFLPIAGTAATLEYAARDGEIEKVVDITPHFLSDYRAYKTKLEAVVAKKDDSEKKEITDKNEVVNIVNELKEKISVFDVHGADLALEKVKSYKYNKDIDNLLSKLSGAVSNLDIDKVEAFGNELIDLISKL